MTDPGLSNRLRQHSRRAGLMVGITMALTIAICVGGFTGIYAGLLPYASDIIPADEREPTRAPTRAPDAAQAAPAAPPTEPPVQEAAPPPPAETPVPEPTPTPTSFQPTHQITGVQSINLRPDPSRDNNPIRVLPIATPLEFLNERADPQLPEDEPGWMKFRTEDNEEGWVRQIDTELYQP